MKNDHLTEVQKNLLKGYKDFHEICEKNKILTIAAYGTFLGAVREKGFISWDDDIDICVFRKDVEKLLTVFSKLSKNYLIYDGEKNKKSPWRIIRIYDLRIKQDSKQKSKKNAYPNNIFIDIFVIDYIKKPMKSIRHSIAGELLYWKNIAAVKPMKFWKQVLKLLLLPIPRSVLFYFYNRQPKKYKSLSPTNQVAFFITEKYVLMDAKIFLSLAKYKFEDMLITGPKDYNLLLTLLYDDWKTPFNDGNQHYAG